jgi:hypothetical protein
VHILQAQPDDTKTENSARVIKIDEETAATMLLAADVPMKVISETLSHTTAAFTSGMYASVAEELQEQAAAAIVPRRNRLADVRAINVPPEAGSDR